MIIVLFGQPNSGKTTIANYIIKNASTFQNIDGDGLREMFANKDYSKEGRIKNLNRASDIAHYLNVTGANVILSLVYPYKEARDHLNSLSKDVVYWIYLTYDGERGREQFHVKDFEEPVDEKVLHINTSSLPLTSCIHLIYKYISGS